jgi:poly(3-hydroxybutyrate) depolymerase
MLHAVAAWQRAGWVPWLTLGRDLLAPIDGARLLTASLDLALLNLAAGEAAPPDLATAVERALGAQVESRVVMNHEFMRLVALRRVHRAPRHRVLLVAPYSGYASAVLASLIAGLLESCEVLVTEWRDGREIPPAAGTFDLDDQIVLVTWLMRELGPGAHVVALSQGVVPALAAAALLAEDAPDAAPRTLALLGGPADSRIDQAPVVRALAALPPQSLAALAFAPVPPGHAGAGRLVHPRLHQLLLIAATHAEPFLSIQLGSWMELSSGASGPWLRGLADLQAVIDVPAELAWDSLYRMLLTAALARGELRVGGRAVRPAAITRTALLTLEAGGDALIGRGQTHAAQRLCPELAATARATVTLRGATHGDLFNGPLAAGPVASRLRRFAAIHAL